MTTRTGLYTIIPLLASLVVGVQGCGGATPRPLPVSPVAATRPTSSIQATTVHKLLRRERDLAIELGDASAEPRYIESLATLDKVLERIEVKVSAMQEPHDATGLLNTIDNVLAEENFVLCIKTDLVTDMLVGSDPGACKGWRSSEHTQQRAANWRRIMTEASEGKHPRVHFFDCDLGSLIFVAAGERLGLPIQMAEIPDHAYIRWFLGSDRFLNWDVNTARSYSDADFAEGTPTASGCRECRRQHDDGLFMPMSTSDVEAYHDVLLGNSAQTRNPHRAEALFRESLRLRPIGALAANNLAWLLAVSPGYLSTEVGLESVTMAQRAVALRPWDVESRDTLSCALAAAGRFPEAREVELSAYANASRLVRIRDGIDCRGLESLKPTR